MPTREQIEQHYRLEKRLAARIMNAAPEERSRVSLEAYDELFATITWHDGHLRSEARRARVRRAYAPVLRLVGEGRDVLELGCGNGDQMRILGPRSRRCVGVDISETVLNHQPDMPANVELLVQDATDLFALEDASFDVAFSVQLVEHIHPEDIRRHLHEVSRVLRPGGRYICETPNPFTGPHDISGHFDDTATCFHLKEYTHRELLGLMREAGFRRFRTPLFRQAMYERFPLVGRLGEVPGWMKCLSERAIAPLPRRQRSRLARMLRLSSVFVVAWKGEA
ncbi:MAG TPA: class I SAM-dependent methyltransferase [Candidatus Krumholzibacteria bacterium]|nr:class I SAM-dependent methyltransferase [Candidatus Krumholzibacteria bacterium]